MSYNDEKLRKVADSWIVVITVFLAMELTSITFSVDYFLEKKYSIELEIYLLLGAVSVATMGVSLATFLGLKDPRMKRFSISALIDKAVFLIFISVIFNSFSLGYGTYIITEKLPIPFLIIGLISGLASILYLGVYRKTIHGKKLGD